MAGIKENISKLFARLGPLLAVILLFVACNQNGKHADASSLEKQQITQNDFEVRIGSDQKKLYLDKDKNPMQGPFVVIKNTLIIEEFELKEGLLNGVYTGYNTLGQKTSTFNYANGILDGESILYYPTTGTVKRKEILKQGKPTGALLTYNKAGNQLIKKVTVDGVHYTHYYRDNKMTYTNFLKNITGKQYDMLIVYDEFENMYRVLGQKAAMEKGKWIFTFDTNFKLTDSIDLINDPTKAKLVYAILSDLASQEN